MSFLLRREEHGAIKSSFKRNKTKWHQAEQTNPNEIQCKCKNVLSWRKRVELIADVVVTGGEDRGFSLFGKASM